MNKLVEYVVQLERLLEEAHRLTHLPINLSIKELHQLASFKQWDEEVDEIFTEDRI